MKILSVLRNKTTRKDEDVNKQILAETISAKESGYIILKVEDESSIKRLNKRLYLIKPDPRRAFLIFNKGYNQLKAPLTAAMTSANVWQVSIAKHSLIQIQFPVEVKLTEDPNMYVRIFTEQKFASTKMIIPSSQIILESGILSLVFYTTAPTYITNSEFIAVLELPTHSNVIITQ